MRRRALLLLLAVGACARAPEREKRVPAFSEPPSIVSLNPCTDAILAEVSAPGQLLAISHYSHDPASSSMDIAKARRFPAVSGSVEEIVQLHPDVVVAGTFLPPATGQALETLGIRVVRVNIAGSVRESEAQVRELAALAGNPEDGEQLVASIERALAAAAPPSRTAPVPAIVWQSGGIVAGDKALVADLLRRTGFANAAAARGLGQADFVPLEVMVADPPRVILTAGDDHSEEDRMLSHPALSRLSGTHQAGFPPSLLWCGGPTIVRAVEHLAVVRRGLDGNEGAK